MTRLVTWNLRWRDFNAEPESDEMRLLGGHSRLVGLGTEVARAALVGVGPQQVDGTPVWPSDHAGVVVDLDPAPRR